MAQIQQMTPGARVFDLAQSLVQLRSFAEVVWCSASDTDEGSDPGLQQIVAIARRITWLLEDWTDDAKTPTVAGHCLSLSLAIAAFRDCFVRVRRDEPPRAESDDNPEPVIQGETDYQQDFADLPTAVKQANQEPEGPPAALPQEKTSTISWSKRELEWKAVWKSWLKDEQPEPELQWSSHKHLVENSPLAGPEWASVEASRLALQAAQSPALQSCFEMGWLLMSEVHHTFTGGERQRTALNETAYLGVDLPAAAEKVAARLQEHFPYLRDFDLSIPKSKPRLTLDKVNELCTKLPRLLQDSLSTPNEGVNLPRPSATFPAPSSASPVAVPDASQVMTPAEFKRLSAIKKRIDPDNVYVGESFAILKVFERIDRFNLQPDKPVLILGSTGTGKTEIAELIHNDARRRKAEGGKAVRKGKFIYYQAGKVVGGDETMLREEWVGYGKDSGISGRSKGMEKHGMIEDAKGGTIFLDELHVAPSWVQTYILAVLDCLPMPRASGTSTPIIPNVRIIFATNIPRDELKLKVNADLLRRISSYEITIPDLNDRKEDIPLLVRLWSQKRKLADKFLLTLLRCDWPGNVGQLKDIVEAAVAQVDDPHGELTTNELHFPDPANQKTLATVTAMQEKEAQQELYQFLVDFFKRQGFEKGEGLQKRIAELLGVSESTVSRRLDEISPT